MPENTFLIVSAVAYICKDIKFMGIIIRQSIKATMVTYVGILIGAFNILWLFPKLLSPEEIGLIRILTDSALLFSFFSLFGNAASIVKFFPLFRDPVKGHNGILTLFLIISVGGFLVATALFLAFQPLLINYFAEKSPEMGAYLTKIIPFGFFMMLLYFMEAYIRSNMRIVIPALVKEIGIRIVSSLLVYLYFTGKINLENLIVFLITSYALGAVYLFYYTWKLGHLYIKPVWSIFKKPVFIEILRFGLLMFLTSICILISDKIDNIMLGAMIGLSFSGIYSIAYFIGTIIEVPKRMISQISAPIIATAWSTGDLEKIGELYKKTSITQVVAGSILFSIIWCNVDDLFSLIPNSEKYISGKYVVLFIAIGRYIDMITGNNTEIIAFSPKYIFNLISIILLACLTIIMNYVLIPVYGIMGAAMATSLSLFLYNLLKFLFIWKNYNLIPFDFNSIKAFLIGSIIILIGISLPDFSSTKMESIIQILVRTILILFLYIFAVYRLKILPELNNLILQHVLRPLGRN